MTLKHLDIHKQRKKKDLDTDLTPYSNINWDQELKCKINYKTSWKNTGESTWPWGCDKFLEIQHQSTILENKIDVKFY
jgi:hypothetical protein